MRDEILAMLKELRPEHDYAGSGDFIADELLDSFDIISLVDMLEEKYGIEMDVEDIIPDHFRTVECIADTITKYLKGNR